MKNRPLLCVCLLVIGMIVLAVATGAEWLIRELGKSPLELYAQEEDPVSCEGIVYWIEQKEKIQAVYLKKISIRCEKASFYEQNLIIYIDPNLKFKIGNTVKVRGKLSFFEPARNPGNFDQKRYYQIRDIHALVWAETAEITDGTVRKYAQKLAEFRSRWQQVLTKVLGQKNGSTLAAMMLGEKSGMDPDLKSLYQINGIGHILAISGLHLSFIGLGAYRILRRATGSYLAGGAAGILFLITYVMMIGMTVSALRALVMFLFRVGADMTGRHYDGPTALSVSAVCVLVWRPLCVYDGGFWLSFGAVLAMFMILPVFGGLPVQGFWASLSVNMLLLPIILKYFFEIPVYAILLNLYVIPLMSALLFLGIAGSLVYLVLPVFGTGILQLSGTILMLYEKGCQAALQLPGARWVIGQPQWYQIAGYYIILGAILFLEMRGRIKKNKENRRICRRVLSICIYGMVIWMLCHRFGENDRLEVVFLDVGQGDCIFLKGPEGTSYLIDGGSSDVEKVGQYRIEPFLKSQGVGTIDYVLLSHGDTDHVNGIEEMIFRSNIGIRIRNLILPEQQFWDEKLYSLADTAECAGISVYVIRAGEELKESELSIVCIAPYEKEKTEKGNEASMVLAVEYEEFSMLLTGDVEGRGEEYLTKKLSENRYKRKWDVLKAAHHGSNSSSSENFLKIVRPACTIISVGKDNPYGHPHMETLQRLQSVGSKILTTQDKGAVMLKVEKHRMFLRRMGGEG